MGKGLATGSTSGYRGGGGGGAFRLLLCSRTDSPLRFLLLLDQQEKYYNLTRYALRPIIIVKSHIVLPEI